MRTKYTETCRRFLKSNPRDNKRTEGRGREHVSTSLPCQHRLFSGHVFKFMLHNILLIHVTSGGAQIWFALRVSAYTPPKVYKADFWTLHIVGMWLKSLTPA